jgi:hypothetical protein
MSLGAPVTADDVLAAALTGADFRSPPAPANAPSDLHHPFLTPNPLTPPSRFYSRFAAEEFATSVGISESLAFVLLGSNAFVFDLGSGQGEPLVLKSVSSAAIVSGSSLCFRDQDAMQIYRIGDMIFPLESGLPSEARVAADPCDASRLFFLSDNDRALRIIRIRGDSLVATEIEADVSRFDVSGKYLVVEKQNGQCFCVARGDTSVLPIWSQKADRSCDFHVDDHYFYRFVRDSHEMEVFDAETLERVQKIERVLHVFKAEAIIIVTEYGSLIVGRNEFGIDGQVVGAVASQRVLCVWVAGPDGRFADPRVIPLASPNSARFSLDEFNKAQRAIGQQVEEGLRAMAEATKQCAVPVKATEPMLESVKKITASLNAMHKSGDDIMRILKEEKAQKEVQERWNARPK